MSSPPVLRHGVRHADVMLEEEHVDASRQPLAVANLVDPGLLELRDVHIYLDHDEVARPTHGSKERERVVGRALLRAGPGVEK